MLQRLNFPAQIGPGELSLADLLEGQLAFSGHFKASLGLRKLAFDGHANGSWQDGSFVLDETFRFADGRREDRTWRLRPDGNGGFTSTCAQAVGCGHVRHTGQGCSHDYLFRLPVGRLGIIVRIRENYLPMDAGTLHYRARLTKWRLPVGEIVMRIQSTARPTAGGSDAGQ